MFYFKFLKLTPKGVLSFQAVKLTGLHLSSLSSRLVNLNKRGLSSSHTDITPFLIVLGILSGDKPERVVSTGFEPVM